MKKNRYTRSRRFLHWAIALSLLFTLMTIFLRLTWMNKNTVAEIMTNELSRLDVKINEDQAVSIAKSIRSPMWEWHVYSGYLLIALYCIRMFVFMVQGVPFRNPISRTARSREKFQSWTYILFYFLLGASLTTGMLILYGPESTHHLMEELHEKSLYWLLVFIILHFMGVLLLELGEKKGIVSKMISGKNKRNNGKRGSHRNGNSSESRGRGRKKQYRSSGDTMD